MGHAEGETGHGFDLGPEAPGGEREAAVVEIESEALVVILVMQREQSLAAHVELEFALAQRPAVGNGDLRVLEALDALAARPCLPEPERGAAERPAVQVEVIAVAPALHLANASAEAVDALGGGERHRSLLAKRAALTRIIHE